MTITIIHKKRKETIAVIKSDSAWTAIYLARPFSTMIYTWIVRQS